MGLGPNIDAARSDAEFRSRTVWQQVKEVDFARALNQVFRDVAGKEVGVQAESDQPKLPRNPDCRSSVLVYLLPSRSNQS